MGTRVVKDEEFSVVVEDLVDLLGRLPQDASTMAECHAIALKWAAQYPDVTIDMILDQPSTIDRVECDLLIGRPDGRTITLALRRNDGQTWSVSQSDHWATNNVVTVNGQNISVHQVLRELELAANHVPNLTKRIVDQVLIAQAVEPVDRAITVAELQARIGAFRAARGLEDRNKMRRWLNERRLSSQDFATIVAGTVISERVATRVTEPDIEPYFLGHQDAYAKLTVCMAYVDTQTNADRLMVNARKAGLLEACKTLLAGEGSDSSYTLVKTAYAADLPHSVQIAAVAEIVGPYMEGSQFGVAQVLRRRSAELDDDTHEAVRRVIYEQWLTKQREAASIEWHLR